MMHVAGSKSTLAVMARGMEERLAISVDDLMTVLVYRTALGKAEQWLITSDEIMTLDGVAYARVM